MMLGKASIVKPKYNITLQDMYLLIPRLSNYIDVRERKALTVSAPMECSGNGETVNLCRNISGNSIANCQAKQLRRNENDFDKTDGSNIPLASW